jgi:acyl phosphate:glycerol-3-phosphate acyltransferase
MSFELAATIAVVVGYLVGSLPFGLLIARLTSGVDIRKQGSGNIGATNVARVLGAKYGAMVLVLDCLKGAIPTAVLPLLLLPPDAAGRQHLAVLTGVSAILGHMFSFWIRFRGGKGVATALGVALVLGPWATVAAFVAFVATFAVWRFVSLSSMLAACVFCGTELALLWPSPCSASNWSLALFSTAVPLLIVIRHRANISRLLQGTEPKFRFGRKKEERPADGNSPAPPETTSPSSPSKAEKS